jgi:hypothetical protein
LGFSTFQKVTSALRMMAYGSSADSLDEYTQMSKSFSWSFLWNKNWNFLCSRWEHFAWMPQAILLGNYCHV